MYVNWRFALFVALVLAGLIAYWWHTRVPVAIVPLGPPAMEAPVEPVREVIVPVVVISPTAQ